MKNIIQNIINLLPRLRRGNRENAIIKSTEEHTRIHCCVTFGKRLKGGIAYVPRNQMFNSVSGNCFVLCN